jgi:hypothetical protein
MDDRDIAIFDVVAQIGINVFGIAAVVLVARENRLGFVFGLAAQPFWFATSLIHTQYGAYRWFSRT